MSCPQAFSTGYISTRPTTAILSKSAGTVDQFHRGGVEYQNHALDFQCIVSPETTSFLTCRRAIDEQRMHTIAERKVSSVTTR